MDKIFENELKEFVLENSEIGIDVDERGRECVYVKNIADLIEDFANYMNELGYAYNKAYCYAADREDYIYDMVMENYENGQDYAESKQ